MRSDEGVVITVAILHFLLNCEYKCLKKPRSRSLDRKYGPSNVGPALNRGQISVPYVAWALIGDLATQYSFDDSLPQTGSGQTSFLPVFVVIGLARALWRDLRRSRRCILNIGGCP